MDIAEVRTVESKPYIYVTMDRMSKLSFVKVTLEEKRNLFSQYPNCSGALQNTYCANG